MKGEESVFGLSDILRAISDGMEKPVVIILIILMAASVFMLGRLFAEAVGERRKLRPELPKLLDRLRACESVEEMRSEITCSGLLRRQKALLLELTGHSELTPPMREAMAAQLLDAEEEHWRGIVRLTDLIARLGPMFGLLGTLIPLGPGIIALGNGDTFTLSRSLLTAFDTTVAGLLAAAVAAVISAVRRRWYRRSESELETAAECLLENMKLVGREKDA
ncbi:MAG: MotA/TolQ/ExbB proton channel family protein [Oscillospiraceae bacterium]|nr:MotA/TolQ/ExbB proton channel family protein [Oscillospiraceae bacterium]